MGLVNLINVPYGFITDIIIFHVKFKSIQLIGAIMILLFNMVAIIERHYGNDEPVQQEIEQPEEQPIIAENSGKQATPQSETNKDTETVNE